METSNGSPPTESGLKEQANMSPSQISKANDMQALERAQSIHQVPHIYRNFTRLTWDLQKWRESNCCSPPKIPILSRNSGSSALVCVVIVPK